MGGHFRVESSELGQLLSQLHTSQDDMRTALNAMKDIGPKSTGSEELDSACDEFHDSWDDAIEKIADGVEKIEEKLKATKNNYDATEEAIQKLFQQDSGGSSQAPATGGAR